MSEGQGVTAASAPSKGTDAGDAAPAPPVVSAPPAAPPAPPVEVEPHVRVDARKLESALLELRHLIVEVPLYLEAPGAGEARAERRKLLSQIDDYLLPRLRQSGAPVLVAL